MHEIEQKLYTIGEVAKLTGVPIKTIRYYTDINLLPVTHRTEARFRLYSTDAIWHLQLIRVLRQLEFSLEEIRAIIGGNHALDTAIDWQLEAITSHIHQLQRIQAVLQQAKENKHQVEHSLTILYELGIALSENATERSHFVTEKLHTLVSQANLPDEWRQSLLDHFTWQSPITLTAQQTSAWIEIVNMLNDPAFAAEALRFNSSTAHQPDNPMHIAEYNQQALALIQEAQSAALKKEPSNSTAVQTLVQNWIALMARLMQRPVTTEFLQELSAQIPTFYSERMQHFWTLMASLSGREAPPSYKEGFDLLDAGLRSFILDQALTLQRSPATATSSNFSDNNRETLSRIDTP